jgi:transcriptional regulator with XRE-family HTH domain
MQKKINRLKVALVEQDKTGKWLAGAIGKNEATISRWCSNVTQPSIETFVQIAEALNVDVRELFKPTKMKE